MGEIRPLAVDVWRIIFILLRIEPISDIEVIAGTKLQN